MSSKKGFTLIELMIVIAIIAIIAAIAIPNLMQSRIRANEATAVTALKSYGTGQVTFQVGKQGRGTVNGAQDIATGYTVNYGNLFYGQPMTGNGNADVDPNRNLALVSRAMADAWITGNDVPYGIACNNTIESRPANPEPYTGYHFGEPANLTGGADWFSTNFAMVAIPANSSSTGNNAYYMGMEGTVYMRGLPADQNAATTFTTVGDAATTPAESSYADWLSM